MFSKSIKAVLAVAVLATAGAVSTNMAQAGGSFGIYIGNTPLTVHGPHHGYNPYFGYYAPRYYTPPQTHTYSGHRIRQCNPRKALNKAYRMGLYNPHITRVNHKKIVVKGFSHGHQAKVVFKRKSNHCKVLKTRGIY